MKRALTEKAVAAELAKRAGNLAAVARTFGVTRQSVHGFVRARPALQRIEEDCRESLKDFAESKLQAAIRKGAAWAICFFLKTQAKDRGYVVRAELGGVGGGPIRVVEDEDWYGNNAHAIAVNGNGKHSGNGVHRLTEGTPPSGNGTH